AYRRLGPAQAAQFHVLFWDVFREADASAPAASWKVTFCGRPIRVPLSRESIGLDWATATAILGHDIEIKQTYASLLRSTRRPELFADVGPNFGPHSLLGRAPAVDTISFEPNAECNRYHRALCAANGIVPRIEAVAVGECRGSIELSYPPDSTWLGTTDSSIRQRLKADYPLETARVEQRTIDDYFDEIGSRRFVMKIDTEGNEMRVLQGASRTLQEKRPLVLFECWAGYQRREIFDVLQSCGYGVTPLPLDPIGTPRLLDEEAFAGHDFPNYAAIPANGWGSN